MDPLRFYFQGLALMSSSSSQSHPTCRLTRHMNAPHANSPTEEWTLDTIQGAPSDPTVTRRTSLSDVEKQVLVSILSGPSHTEMQACPAKRTLIESSLQTRHSVDVCTSGVRAQTAPTTDGNGRDATNVPDHHPHTPKPLASHFDENDSQVEGEELCNLLLTLQSHKPSAIPQDRQEEIILTLQSSSLSTDMPLSGLVEPDSHISIPARGAICWNRSSSSCSSSIHSDEEVRVEKTHDPTTTLTGHDTKISFVTTNNEPEIELDDESSASSWNMKEGGFRHYDAWTVLQDEYAPDFGFSFSNSLMEQQQHSTANQPDNTAVHQHSISESLQLYQQEPEDDDDVEDKNAPFHILGTSMEDVNAHPHVLSPPLMASLTQFLPESLVGQNFWLKYSLIRDGACMNTLLRYVRAAQHTILAIETSEGHVLGCFTSNAWKVHPQGYYGSGEAFVWAMRYSRLTPCFSLYDQAQLESDIDIFPYSALNSYVQLCTQDRIAVGGGTLPTTTTYESSTKDPSSSSSSTFSYPDYVDETDEKLGSFAIMIQKDLTQGVSCPSATFRNPCLIHHASTLGETFQIVNMEVWTFTPCTTVEDAEKLEMRKYFIESGVHSSDTNKSSSHSLATTHDHHQSHHSHSPSPKDNLPLTRLEHSGSDYSKKGFYRRVGDVDENDVDREGQEQQQSWG